jgi:hypothetical protein
VRGYPRQHNLRSRKDDPAEGQNSSILETLLNVFPLQEVRAQAPRGGQILETLLLPLMRSATICLAISPGKLDKLIEAQAVWKSALASWKREGRAVAILPDF